MKKMKQLGCFMALIFMTLFVHPLQAQQLNEVKISHTGKERTDSSKRVLIADIRLSPIPAKDILALQFQTEQASTVHIQIISIIGRVVHETKLTTDGGLYTGTFNIAKIPRGTYFLSVSTGQNTQTKRFVKR